MVAAEQIKTDGYLGSCAKLTSIGGSAWRGDVTTLHRILPFLRQMVKMVGEKTQNVQDVFLNHVRKNKVAVTVFLVNGVKLQGTVTWFDNFCILLRRDNQSQLVYKHAVSTVMPGEPIQLFDPTKNTDDA